jgi:hypothetical protein
MPLSKDPRAALRHWLAGGEPPRPDGEQAALSLARSASEQGLAGLLLAALGPGEDPWPAPARGLLRDAQRRSLVRGVRQLEMAGRAARLLHDDGLRALPLKGAALAESLYETVADRPMADVDLLVLTGFPRAARLLEAAGFVCCARADHAWAFQDPRSGAILELHRGLTSCPGLFPYDPEALWARSRPGRGQVPRLPSVADVLVHLCLHAAFQHGLVLSLVQWLDLRRLLEQAPPEPSGLAQVASDARAEAALAAALEAARAVVGVSIPAAIEASFTPFLPKSFGKWLQRRIEEPLALVAPSRVPLARTRWGLLAGRRRELLSRTLGGEAAPASSLEARLGAVGRAVGVAWRWWRRSLTRPAAGA